MSPEVHVPFEALAVRFNGKFYPTDRGHLVHDLVLNYRILKHGEDQGEQFSMSEEMKQNCREKLESLSRQLKLPEDVRIREKIIQKYDKYLTKVGLPYNVNIK